jgi:hypothetical protein
MLPSSDAERKEGYDVTTGLGFLMLLLSLEEIEAQQPAVPAAIVSAVQTQSSSQAEG